MALRSQHLCESFLVYDKSMWPLVVATVQPKSSPTHEQFQAHLDCFSELLQLNEPFCIMFDVRQASPIPFSMLLKQAEQMRTMEAQIKRNLVCSSIVVNNALVRGLIKMLFSVRPPSRPNNQFATRKQAEEWMLKFWEQPAHPTTTDVVSACLDDDGVVSMRSEDTISMDSQPLLASTVARVADDMMATDPNATQVLRVVSVRGRVPQ